MLAIHDHATQTLKQDLEGLLRIDSLPQAQELMELQALPRVTKVQINSPGSKVKISAHAYPVFFPRGFLTMADLEG